MRKISFSVEIQKIVDYQVHKISGDIMVIKSGNSFREQIGILSVVDVELENQPL